MNTKQDDVNTKKGRRGKQMLLRAVFVFAVMWLLTVLTTKPLPSQRQPSVSNSSTSTGLTPPRQSSSRPALRRHLFPPDTTTK